MEIQDQMSEIVVVQAMYDSVDGGSLLSDKEH